MFSEETVRLLFKVQQAAKVVIPVLLSLDMVHNVYYVRNLWLTRLREWREQENAAITVQMSQICQHMVQKCHTNHKDLWPAILAPRASAAVPVVQHTNQGAQSHIGQTNETAHDDFLFDLGMTSRSQSRGDPPGCGQAASPAEPASAASSRGQTMDASAWSRLQQALLERWQSAGLDAALKRIQLPHGWSSQLPEGWRPLSTAHSWWARCSDSVEAQMQSLDAQLQRALMQMPLPQVSCSRRSALRFRVHHCDWQALSALLAPRQPHALELVLEPEPPQVPSEVGS